MKMEHKEFSKDHTLITKGLLVIILLIHHTFFPDNVAEHGVNTIIANQALVNRIVIFCKICIAGFAFLSAYGMTISFKKLKCNDAKFLFISSVRRLIKLLSGVVIIYVLAVLYRQFVMKQPIQELYTPGEKNIYKTALWMFIDMIGMADYVGTPLINVTWWYLSYAIMLILIMPLLYMIYQKFRYTIIPVGCLLPYAVMVDKMSFVSLLPAVMLGTAFAYEGWFTDQGTRIGRAVKIAVCFLLLYTAYIMGIYIDLFYAYTLVFSIPCIVYLLVGYIPILRDVLKFIGKNSANIFLTHTFIYYYFYTDFIYSFHDSWLILTVLLGTSLLLSLVIELIKKITGYNLLVNKALAAYDRKWGKSNL